MKVEFLTLKDAEILEKKGFIVKENRWDSSWSRMTWYGKTEKGIEITGSRRDLMVFWDDVVKDRRVPNDFFGNQKRICIRQRHSLQSVYYESTKDFWNNILGKLRFKKIIIKSQEIV